MCELTNELKRAADPVKGEVYKRFFKTGEGQYGHGDIFLGLTVPQTREIAKKFYHISLDMVKTHLRSPNHEERLASLYILVDKFKKENREEIFNFYLENKKFVNNWDLVDSSADKIVGEYLFDKDKKILYELVKSDILWDRRIAIIATFAFIKKGKFDETIKIAEILMNDKHDLIHKAVGWMLREMGKRDQNYLVNFLDKNAHIMPRTMLRYAIEKFPEQKRKEYLNKRV